jgi:nucleotide-binding universal stress UspA family protein
VEKTLKDRVGQPKRTSRQRAGAQYPYKIILCPVDFEENSLAALGHACRLADDMGATIHLLHILPILPMVSDEGMALDDKAAEAGASRRLKEIARRRLGKRPYELHTRITFPSDVTRAIVGVAGEIGADLIVMGTHGRGGLKHVLLGSVAEAVVRNATCPVLTLRFNGEPVTMLASASTKGPSRTA